MDRTTTNRARARVVLVVGVLVLAASGIAAIVAVLCLLLWRIVLWTPAGVGYGPALDGPEFCRLAGHPGSFSRESWPPAYSCGTTLITPPDVTRAVMDTWTFWIRVLRLAALAGLTAFGAVIVTAFRRDAGESRHPVQADAESA